MSVSIIIGTTEILTEEISIAKTIDSLCDSFTLRLPNIKLDVHAKVSIKINNTNAMSGYINKINHAQPNTLSLAGRSLSQDIIDSRITYVTHNKTLAELATDLFSKFNQPFTTKVKTQSVKDFSIVAESAFEALNQLAKQQNLLFIENVNGSVTLVKPADVDNSHIHLNARNLSDFQISEDLSKFFHTTKVKTNPNAENLDYATHNNYHYKLLFDKVRATRIQEVVADKLTNHQACEDRANELTNLAFAQGITASGTSMGWLDPAGKEWKTNSLYTVNNKRMLLASATFNQTGRSQITKLQFKGHGQNNTQT